MSKLEDGYTRRDRYNPETEKTLRQFLSMDGPKGATDRYRLRHTYTFDLAAEDQARVDKLVEDGMEFESAVELVVKWGRE